MQDSWIGDENKKTKKERFWNNFFNMFDWVVFLLICRIKFIWCIYVQLCVILFSFLLLILFYFSVLSAPQKMLSISVVLMWYQKSQRWVFLKLSFMAWSLIRSESENQFFCAVVNWSCKSVFVLLFLWLDTLLDEKVPAHTHPNR